MFLIWSNQKRMWWRAFQSGYTDAIEEAGRYTRRIAADIVASATVNGRLTHRRVDPVNGREYTQLDEVMVLAPEDIPDGES
jgi:hypothetical protein